MMEIVIGIVGILLIVYLFVSIFKPESSRKPTGYSMQRNMGRLIDGKRGEKWASRAGCS